MNIPLEELEELHFNYIKILEQNKLNTNIRETLKTAASMLELLSTHVDITLDINIERMVGWKQFVEVLSQEVLEDIAKQKIQILASNK